MSTGPDNRVVVGLSGGVDSAVTAALVHRAIGDQLLCIFVNNGLLRREEPERVVETFRRNMKINLVYVDATDHFMACLDGVGSPEAKRLIDFLLSREVVERMAQGGAFQVPLRSDVAVPGGGYRLDAIRCAHSRQAVCDNKRGAILH